LSVDPAPSNFAATREFFAAFAFLCGKSFLSLARHYGFRAEESDFILNYDTRLRCAAARQVKDRLGRETESEEE
jgi:hypothetical protein